MQFSTLVKQTMESYSLWLKEHSKILSKEWGADSEEQQITLRHKLSLGGTAVSSIIGSNPYQSSLNLYDFMLGNTPPIEQNYQMLRGIYMEKLVATRAAQLLNKPLFYPNSSSYDPENNIVISTYEIQNQANDNCENSSCLSSFLLEVGISFLSAQFDSFICEPNDEGSMMTIVECKTASRNTTKKDGTRVWGTPLELNKYGDLLNDDGTHCVIPKYYVDQVQWQLLILKILSRRGDNNVSFNTDYAFVAVDIGGCSEISLYKIHADSKRQSALLESAAYFMLNNIIKQEPPIGFDAINPPSEGNELEVYKADSTFIDAYTEYQEIKATIKELTVKADKLKKELEQSLSGIEVGSIIDLEGNLLARKIKVMQSRLDSKALANEEPEIYQKYKKTSDVYRVDYY